MFNPLRILNFQFLSSLKSDSQISDSDFQTGGVQAALIGNSRQNRQCRATTTPPRLVSLRSPLSRSVEKARSPMQRELEGEAEREGEAEYGTNK